MIVETRFLNAGEVCTFVFFSFPKAITTVHVGKCTCISNVIMYNVCTVVQMYMYISEIFH